MHISFKIFKSFTKSWETICQEAAEFASAIGRERLINISATSQPAITGITVWYWENDH